MLPLLSIPDPKMMFTDLAECQRSPSPTLAIDMSAHAQPASPYADSCGGSSRANSSPGVADPGSFSLHQPASLSSLDPVNLEAPFRPRPSASRRVKKKRPKAESEKNANWQIYILYIYIYSNLTI